MAQLATLVNEVTRKPNKTMWIPTEAMTYVVTRAHLVCDASSPSISLSLSLSPSLSLSFSHLSIIARALELSPFDPLLTREDVIRVRVTVSAPLPSPPSPPAPQP